MKINDCIFVDGKYVGQVVTAPTVINDMKLGPLEHSAPCVIIGYREDSTGRIETMVVSHYLGAPDIEFRDAIHKLGPDQVERARRLIATIFGRAHKAKSNGESFPADDVCSAMLDLGAALRLPKGETP